MNIRTNTCWNILGSASPMLISLLAIPYIYRNIGIERIGILTIIWALIGYFSIFDFGLGRALTQRIARLPITEVSRQKICIATTGVFLTLLLGLLGSLVGFLAIQSFGVRWLHASSILESEIRISFLWASLAIPAVTATAGLRGILEGEQRFKGVNLLKLFLGLSNFLGPITIISLQGPRLDNIVETIAITRYLVLIAHFFAAKNSIGTNLTFLSVSESKELFRFGGWMTLSNIVSPLMVVADRMLISNLLGAAIVGFYTVPSDIMIRLLILPSAITTSVFPVFTNELSHGNYSKATKLYKKSTHVIALLMLVVSLAIFYFAWPALNIWLGSKFADASANIMYILAVGIFINSIAQIPHAFIQASGDSRSTALIHLLESSIYIPILIGLVRSYGIFGAALAWTFRAALDLALLHARSTRLFA